MKDKASEEGNIMAVFPGGSLEQRENMSLSRITEALSRGAGWTQLCLIPLPCFIKSIHPHLAVNREAVPKRDFCTTLHPLSF